MSDKLLTTRQVADELQVSTRTVRRLAAARDLEVIDLGHRTKRVRRTELDRFIAAKESRQCS